jgi:hypothetical protein
MFCHPTISKYCEKIVYSKPSAESPVGKKIDQWSKVLGFRSSRWLGNNYGERPKNSQFSFSSNLALLPKLFVNLFPLMIWSYF